MFDCMGALSTQYNDQPERASRAFDKTRDGFVIAGGSGVLVLEEMEHAKKRGAKVRGPSQLPSTAARTACPAQRRILLLGFARRCSRAACVSLEPLPWIKKAPKIPLRCFRRWSLLLQR